jgi:hypothetical protein
VVRAPDIVVESVPIDDFDVHASAMGLLDDEVEAVRALSHEYAADTSPSA